MGLWTDYVPFGGAQLRRFAVFPQSNAAAPPPILKKTVAVPSIGEILLSVCDQLFISRYMQPERLWQRLDTSIFFVDFWIMDYHSETFSK